MVENIENKNSRSNLTATGVFILGSPAISALAFFVILNAVKEFVF
jgi:hypothetical protein